MSLSFSHSDPDRWKVRTLPSARYAQILLFVKNRKRLYVCVQAFPIFAEGPGSTELYARAKARLPSAVPAKSTSLWNLFPIVMLTGFAGPFPLPSLHFGQVGSPLFFGSSLGYVTQ